MWIQLVTISVSAYLFAISFGFADFSCIELFSRFMPITYTKWWFASVYFVMYLFSPFINEYLCGLNKDRYRTILIFVGFIWVLLPTLTGKRLESNHLLWFFYLFAIGGYIRLYAPINMSLNNCLLIFALSFLFSFASMALFTAISPYNWWFADNMYIFYDYQMLPTLISSIFLFLIFLKLDIKSKLINTIASTAFGVYLIHDDTFMRRIIWKRLLNGSSHLYGRMIIPYSIYAIISVFIMCSVLEYIRMHIVEPLYKSKISSLDFKTYLKKHNPSI